MISNLSLNDKIKTSTYLGGYPRKFLEVSFNCDACDRTCKVIDQLTGRFHLVGHILPEFLDTGVLITDEAKFIKF
jgi:hypothetical protein